MFFYQLTAILVYYAVSYCNECLCCNDKLTEPSHMERH